MAISAKDLIKFFRDHGLNIAVYYTGRTITGFAVFADSAVDFKVKDNTIVQVSTG